MKLFGFLFAMILSTSAFAHKLEGEWVSESGKTIVLREYKGWLTINTRSYYDNGAPSDYFFAFGLPAIRDVRPGEYMIGRMRSIDGYYGCLFEEGPDMQYTPDGNLRMHYPLLSFTRDTRSRPNERFHEVSWDRWAWVESLYSFPIERWRMVSSECTIVQRKWYTEILRRPAREVPRPN